MRNIIIELQKELTYKVILLIKNIYLMIHYLFYLLFFNPNKVPYI